MVIQTHVASRSALADAIADELHTAARYLGVPSCAFRVGAYTIDRDGAIHGEDFRPLRSFLLLQRYIDEDTPLCAAEENATGGHKMETVKERFERLQKEQREGTYTLCPRCGRDIMKKPLDANVRSRISDIWICESCGEAQAERETMNVPDDLYCWLTLQPCKPKQNFRMTSCFEAWKKVIAEQGDTIRELRDRAEAGEDTKELNFEAFERLPGLTAIYFSPIHLVYKCADGGLHVRFDNGDYGAELVGHKSDSAGK